MGTGDREYYEDLWAQPWTQPQVDPSAGYRTRHRVLLRCLRKVYRPGVSVLDVGCGSGLLLRQIRAGFPGVGNLAGTDISEVALNLARAAVPRAWLFRSDVQTDPLPTQQAFDIVICSEVLEHLRDWRAAMAHMAQALRPGGTLIVTVPHSMRWWCPLDEAVRHFRRYERAELCDAFLAEALLPEHVFTWGGPIYDLYYRLLLNRAKPEATWKEQSRLVRGFEKVLYGALFLDDLFSGARIGKMLFGVARKPL